jgi:O-antigen/teichoic acid export membrane protein
MERKYLSIIIVFYHINYTHRPPRKLSVKMLPFNLLKMNLLPNTIRSYIPYIKEKWQHAGFQKYLKNTGWMFAGRIFSMILSFIVSVYVARQLGVENYGTLNFVISFVSIAGITFFVIDSLLLKKLNNEPENTNKLLGSALAIKLINSVITILTATIASLLFANNNITTIFIFTFSTFTIFQSVNVVDFYFQAHAKLKNISILFMLTGIVSALIKIIIVSLNLNIIYILLTYVFDHIIAAIGYVYLYRKNIGKISDWKVDVTIVKNLMINSWPFTLSSIAANIYGRADQIFLKVLLGSKAVGLYVVAVRFSEVWFFISGVICVSLLPAILNAQKTNHDLFLTRSKRLFSLLFYISILICIFIFLMAPFIIKILYGPEYLPSIALLRIYIWSIIGIFISTVLQQILLAQNRFKTILLLNIFGMLLSLVFNYLFIPLWGIKGAAIANIIAYTLPVVIILSFKKMRDQRSALIKAILHPLS